jgi:hypothetical protein
VNRRLFVCFYCFAGILVLPPMLMACNGRPTYDIRVSEFSSNCKGDVAVQVEHNPDPEFETIKVEPSFLTVAEQAQLQFSSDGSYVTVKIGSDISCRHLNGMGRGECSSTTNDPLPCRAYFKLIAYRWPTRGSGFGGSRAKQGEDTPVPPDPRYPED